MVDKSFAAVSYWMAVEEALDALSDYERDQRLWDVSVCMIRALCPDKLKGDLQELVTRPRQELIGSGSAPRMQRALIALNTPRMQRALIALGGPASEIRAARLEFNLRRALRAIGVLPQTTSKTWATALEDQLVLNLIALLDGPTEPDFVEEMMAGLLEAAERAGQPELFDACMFPRPN